jgi:hypothetical protein
MSKLIGIIWVVCVVLAFQHLGWGFWHVLAMLCVAWCPWDRILLVATRALDRAMEGLLAWLGRWID